MSPIPSLMIDGRLVEPGGARVLLDDAFVRGDGVFEGIRVYDRRPRTPGEHLDRLARSADVIDLPIDRGRLQAELAEFCRALSIPDCAVRLMVSRGGQVVWREEPVPNLPAAVRVLPVHHRVTPLLIGSKTLSYAPNMQAQRRAQAAGFDEALLVRADDDAVLEGPVQAFAWVEGDELVFPPIEVGVLDSLTRRIAMEVLPSRTREARVDDLAEADGAFLMSSVWEAVPLAELSGVATYDPASPTVIAMRDAIAAACAERAAG